MFLCKAVLMVAGVALITVYGYLLITVGRVMFSDYTFQEYDFLMLGIFLMDMIGRALSPILEEYNREI